MTRNPHVLPTLEPELWIPGYITPVTRSPTDSFSPQHGRHHFRGDHSTVSEGYPPTSEDNEEEQKPLDDWFSKEADWSYWETIVEAIRIDEQKDEKILPRRENYDLAASRANLGHGTQTSGTYQSPSDGSSPPHRTIMNIEKAVDLTGVITVANEVMEQGGYSLVYLGNWNGQTVSP